MNSAAGRHFPFDCFRRSGWEDVVSATLQRASEEAGVSGIFLLVAAPHGYEFQHLAVCLGGNRAEGAVWANTTGETQTWSIGFSHDPELSLDRIRSRWQERRVAIGTERDPTRGRNVTVFVAATGRGAWLTCQSPLTNAAGYDELDTLIFDLQRIPKTRDENRSDP